MYDYIVHMQYAGIGLTVMNAIPLIWYGSRPSDYWWKGSDYDNASWGVIWSSVTLGTWKDSENTKLYGGIRRLTIKAATKDSNVHGSR